jgi:hypothetical protein
MKLHLIALLAALLLASSMSSAQTQGDLVIDIPFPFVIPGGTLPPGHYIASTRSETLNIHERQTHGVFVPTHGAQRRASENGSRMVFHRYGDTYFLSEVWIGSDPTGRVLAPSRAERKLAERNTKKEVTVLRVTK